MRALLLTLVLVSTAAAQSAPTPAISVVDENGVAVNSARITLQSPTQAAMRCQTISPDAASSPLFPPAQYHIHVEKEGFYALDQPAVQIDPSSAIEVTSTTSRKSVKSSTSASPPPAIDPTQVSSRKTLTGLDVINIVYPGHPRLP